MVYIPTTPKTFPLDTQTNQRPALDTTLKAALEHARRLTAMYGTGTIEVALAWETVEELQTAKARRPATQPSAFDRYCAANPDAPECRIYEI